MSLRLGVVFAALAVAGCSAVHWGQEKACAVPAGTAATAVAVKRLPQDLQIVSWNLHGTPYNGPMQARIARIAAKLAERRPDVVLLQEVWFEGDARLIEAALQAHYDRVADDRGVRRGLLGLLAGLRSGGLLAFVRKGSGWRPRASVFDAYDVQGPAWRVFEGDGLGVKGVQALEVENAGSRVAIFHTHLQAQYGDRRYRRVRTLQLQELERMVQQSTARVSLAIGDFNTAPHGDDLPLYAAMLGFWDDLTTKLRLECNCGGTHLRQINAQGRVESAWVDYAFARRSSAVRVVHSELIRSSGVDCPFSDHHGIELHLALGR